MLGKTYNVYKDCCGTMVTKQQYMEIKLNVGDGNMAKIPEQSMNQLSPQGTYNTGKIYRNLYLPYVMCIQCQMCVTHSYQIEMNGEKVSESRLPYFCPIYGPYPVQGKNSEHLGELKPHCYCCHACPWNWWWPCCTSLSVFDGKMAEAYVVKRECCTCGCCTRWNVYDQMQNIRAEIKQTGWCCPNFQITLP